MFSPVINPDLSEHKNITIFAMSSGIPPLRTPCCYLSSFENSELVVSIHPGEIQFTLAIPFKVTLIA